MPKCFLCLLFPKLCWHIRRRPTNEQTPGEEQDNSVLQMDSQAGYELAVTDLKSSNVWRDNQDVQTWLSMYWLSIPMVSKYPLVCTSYLP